MAGVIDLTLESDDDDDMKLASVGTMSDYERDMAKVEEWELEYKRLVEEMTQRIDDNHRKHVKKRRMLTKLSRKLKEEGKDEEARKVSHSFNVSCDRQFKESLEIEREYTSQKFIKVKSEIDILKDRWENKKP